LASEAAHLLVRELMKKSADRVFSGRCACGSVAFEAHGWPNWVGICHCATCRRATGGISIAAAGFAKESVRMEGPTLAEFASSPGVVRSFCAACGTSLSYRSARWPDDVHLMVGALDRPEALQPQFHIFFDERVPWACPSDDLPKYRSTPGEGILASSV
jgi:hypothetical protein